ncbi:MAG: hypothetical protein ACREIB_09450 [Pseudomonadota bacterium]
MAPVEAVLLIAALVTATLLGYAAAVALAGVQFLLDWRSPPRRNLACAALCQYAGTALALLGLVYRHQQIGTIGLLLVILSLFIADFRRASTMPRFEAALSVLALVNLVALTALFVA